MALLDAVQDITLDLFELLGKIHHVEKLQKVQQMPQLEVTKLHLSAVEVEEHLFHHGLGVGQLDQAGGTFQKVVAEHPREVLGSDAEDQFTSCYLTVICFNLDITKLRLLERAKQITAKILLVLQSTFHPDVVRYLENGDTLLLFGRI